MKSFAQGVFVSLLLCFSASLLLLSACATARFAVKRIGPARYDITGINRVGLMNFGTEVPAYTNGALAITTVIENKLVANGFFDVAPRINQHNGMPIQTSPVVLSDFMAEVGREKGVDAIVFGLVDHYDARTDLENRKIVEEKPTGRYRTEIYSENGIQKTRQVEIKEKIVRYELHALRKAAVNFRSYVLRSSNARYIGKDVIADGRELKAKGKSRIDALPSEQYLLSELTDKLADRFVANITPHEVTDYIKLKGDKTCKDGVKLAKTGNWDGAIDIFEAALKENPANHLALYNLGIAYEYQRDYERARGYYRDAMKLANKPLYNEAWVRVHDIMQQNERLERQMKGR